MMRPVWNTLLKGLAAVLPVGLTIYLVYWLGVTVEDMLRAVITQIVPEQYYWPGMGLVAGVALLFLVGLAINAWVVRRVFGLGGALLERIPLVKSIYGALRDFADYLSTAQQRKDLRNVVLITFGDARLIGFLMREKVDDVPELAAPGDMVAVYLPMSYQIGGYTVYLPRSRTEPVDLSVEEAMRLVLTAGLSKRQERVD